MTQWRCTRNLFMEDEQQCFTKDKIYSGTKDSQGVINTTDDQGLEHSVGKMGLELDEENWSPYFEEIVRSTSDFKPKVMITVEIDTEIIFDLMDIIANSEGVANWNADGSTGKWDDFECVRRLKEEIG